MGTTSEITNFAGQTFRVGSRVRHSDGWTGTVIGIDDRQHLAVDLLLVQPDDCSMLRGSDCERPLNDAAAAQAGRATFCRPRDHGRSMGNYTPIA